MVKVLAEKKIQFKLRAADSFRFPTGNTQVYFQVLLCHTAMQSQKNNGFQEVLQAKSPSNNAWERIDYLAVQSHTCDNKTFDEEIKYAFER
jgi:hypothetical protein